MLQHNTVRVSHSRKSGKSAKKVKNQTSTSNVNFLRVGNAEDPKVGSKQSQLIQRENYPKHEPPTQQQPLLITSTGELGNVEFLQQTVDDQTGQVITTALPMMTTADGTTVVQVRG